MNVFRARYTEKRKADYIIPACCTDEIWDGKFSPCGMPPVERPAAFDSKWCEEISDLCTLQPYSCLPDAPPYYYTHTRSSTVFRALDVTFHFPALH